MNSEASRSLQRTNACSSSIIRHSAWCAFAAISASSALRERSARARRGSPERSARTHDTHDAHVRRRRWKFRQGFAFIRCVARLSASERFQYASSSSGGFGGSGYAGGARSARGHRTRKRSGDQENSN